MESPLAAMRVKVFLDPRASQGLERKRFLRLFAASAPAGRMLLMMLLSAALGLLAPAAAQAQQTGTIEGAVTDSTTGGPLPGVNVVVVGTQQGASTDAEGNYTVRGVEAGTYALQASFVGYDTKTEDQVTVRGGETTTVDFSLPPSMAELGEVVVVGYGEEEKANVTGSVSSIDGEALQDLPVTQASQALAGQASGVTIRQTSGAPGKGGADIRIRGFGTFSSAGNNPLVIVDGMPSSLDNIDPKEHGPIIICPSIGEAFPW